MIITAYALAAAAVLPNTLLEAAAAVAAKNYIYADPQHPLFKEYVDTTVAAGRYAFPVYDRILAPSSHPTEQEVQRIFVMLQVLPVSVARYVPAARRLALSHHAQIKAPAIKFLGRHGGPVDIKLALAFLLTTDSDVSHACLDVLARFGGPDEAVLLESALDYNMSTWHDSDRNYARDCLAVLKKRLAAEAAKPAAKP